MVTVMQLFLSMHNIAAFRHVPQVQQYAGCHMQLLLKQVPPNQRRLLMNTLRPLAVLLGARSPAHC